MKMGLVLGLLSYLFILKIFANFKIRLTALIVFPVFTAIYPTYVLQAEILPYLQYGHAIFAIASLTGWVYLAMMAIGFYAVTFLTLLSVFILWTTFEKNEGK